MEVLTRQGCSYVKLTSHSVVLQVHPRPFNHTEVTQRLTTSFTLLVRSRSTVRHSAASEYCPLTVDAAPQKLCPHRLTTVRTQRFGSPSEVLTALHLRLLHVPVPTHLWAGRSSKKAASSQLNFVLAGRQCTGSPHSRNDQFVVVEPSSAVAGSAAAAVLVL